MSRALLLLVVLAGVGLGLWDLLWRRVRRERPGGYCTDCGHAIASFDGLSACPACGTPGLLCAWSDQVDLSVNWHELRILVMWAENYAREHARDRSITTDTRKTVYAIARRLKAQHPDRAPLTFAEELGEVAGEYRMAVNDPELRRDIAEQTGREVDLFRREQDDA